MNIFFLHRDPAIAAHMLHNKHVVKMVLETAQMLSTACHARGQGEGLYKPTHENHPCVLWATESLANFWWLLEHGLELCYEYTYRFGKVHKSQEMIVACSMVTSAGAYDPRLVSPPQCMPDEYMLPGDPVTAYRNYYLGRKVAQSKWTRRPVPDIFKEAYEMSKKQVKHAEASTPAPADAPVADPVNTAPKQAIGVKGPKGAALDATITVLTDKNPKREGSKAHAVFALYASGMTVQDFMNAAGPAATSNIVYDAAHGFIAVAGYDPKLVVPKARAEKTPKAPKAKKEKAAPAAPSVEQAELEAATVEETID